MRTCVGCRRTGVRSELIRVVVTRPGPDAADGETRRIVVDGRRALPGRGAWVHPTERCWNIARKKNAFTRALRAPGLPVPEAPSNIRSSAESG
ncbi:YlxR family protein [Brevibacterium litoralis]|uniref:YlxR family protein n=1 Tax=Brevibacterium litoralis TaxID=3138935 RepID=UPI0032EF86FB